MQTNVVIVKTHTKLKQSTKVIFYRKENCVFTILLVEGGASSNEIRIDGETL